MNITNKFIAIKTKGETLSISVSATEEEGHFPSPFIPTYAPSHKFLKTNDSPFYISRVDEGGDWEIEMIVYKNKRNGSLVTSLKDGGVGAYDNTYEAKVVKKED